MSPSDLLKSRKATTNEALELFDSLEPVDIDFMLGSWKGAEFRTDHPLDGLLETYHWHGKQFDSAEEVHPLVFRTAMGGLAHVNPIFVSVQLSIADRVPMPKFGWLGRVFQFMLPLFETLQSRARLRMTNYRGKSSATMIYDQVPVLDVFRKIDDDTVLGLMDLKGIQRPFFFILQREIREI